MGKQVWLPGFGERLGPCAVRNAVQCIHMGLRQEKIKTQFESHPGALWFGNSKVSLKAALCHYFHDILSRVPTWLVNSEQIPLPWGWCRGLERWPAKRRALTGGSKWLSPAWHSQVGRWTAQDSSVPWEMSIRGTTLPPSLLIRAVSVDLQGILYCFFPSLPTKVLADSDLGCGKPFE